MTDAARYSMPFQLRHLFCTLLVYNSVSDPLGLWEHSKPWLMEDLTDESDAIKEQKCVILLEKLMEEMGTSLQSFGFEVPDSLETIQDVTITEMY
jgi:hypothetical protein